MVPAKARSLRRARPWRQEYGAPLVRADSRLRAAHDPRRLAETTFEAFRAEATRRVRRDCGRRAPRFSPHLHRLEGSRGRRRGGETLTTRFRQRTRRSTGPLQVARDAAPDARARPWIHRRDGLPRERRAHWEK